MIKLYTIYRCLITDILATLFSKVLSIEKLGRYQDYLCCWNDIGGWMMKISLILSMHIKGTHAIHGCNTHLPATLKNKTCWFVYLEEGFVCEFQYIGSTTSKTHIWDKELNICIRTYKQTDLPPVIYIYKFMSGKNRK